MNPVANPLFQYLPFLAVLGSLGLFWSQIRIILSKIFSIIVVKSDFEDVGYTVFNGYLNRNFHKYRLGASMYDGFTDYTTTDKRTMAIGFECPTTLPQLYRKGKNLAFVKQTRTQNRADCLSIYYIRGTFDVEAHYLAALAEYNNGKTERRSFKVHFRFGSGKKSILKENGAIANSNNGSNPEGVPRHLSNRILGYSLDQIGYRDKKNINTGYVFSTKAESVLDECKQWRASEEWYKTRGILWRRGILLSSRPGGGKTSLVRKICQTIDVPLFVFDLASMSNSEMIEAWRDIQSYSPCAVLFDDIDRIWSGNVNVVGDQGGGLTLDCLLGCISGAMPCEGTLVFGTVNDPSRLDAALGVIENGKPSRPGRFDSIVELDDMTETDRRKLVRMIFEGLDYDTEQLIKNGDGMTAAQFNDYCAKNALDIYWKNVTAN